MIDVLDNLIGSASDLPDPTKTIAKNIDQINSDLSAILNVKTTWAPAVQDGNTYIGPFDKPCFVNVSGSKTSASNYGNHYVFYKSDGTNEDVTIMNPSQTGIFNIAFMLGVGEHATLSIFASSATVFLTK
jgi:hypothetical protein